MRKKVQRFGYVLLLSGTVLFGTMHLAIALYMPSLQSWNHHGKFVAVLTEIRGWVPYILSIVFMVAGIAINIYGLLEKSIQNHFEKIQERNRQWEQEINNQDKSK